MPGRVFPTNDRLNMNLDDVSLIVGLDWADRTHVCCLFGRDGLVQGNVRVEASAEGVARWLDGLQVQYPAGTIVVAVEKTEGALVEMIQGRSRFALVPVNPATLHRYRQTFLPSGSKNDPVDAHLLGEIVMLHPEKFEVRKWSTDELTSLAQLVVERRHWVDTRSGLVEELISCLKKYYPQALELTGEHLYTRMDLEYLRRWPDLGAAKRAKWSTLAAFYRQHHSGRSDVLQRRQEMLKAAHHVSEREAYVMPLRLHMLTIVSQLEAINGSIEQFDAQIQEAYTRAPGRHVIDSLPGTGPAMAPRLWVACANEGQGPCAGTMQLKSGIAPVRRQSGNTKVTAFRWARPKFLHQTWIEFAQHSLKTSAWARAFYLSRKTRGDRQASILRALAYKWIRIIAKLWRDQCPYDEGYYLKHSALRKAST